MKEQLKILTCGSVDNGKSTILGHMIYDSKMLYLDQKHSLEIDSKIKNDNDEIDYSLLLDGLDEEREQGITIDIAYRYFNTNKRNFIILDAPGHEEYTRNMAVGASQADLALLLIDATKGIKLQSKRHFKICMMMGIKDYVVAINKMDLIEYNQKEFIDISNEIKRIFESEKINSLYIIPVSAKNGDNVNNISVKMKWYSGVPLLEYLEGVDINKSTNLPFVLPIQRVIRSNQDFRGFQGKVVSGCISKGESIFCLPSKERTNVKEILNLDKSVSKIFCGQSVTLMLDREIDVSRGCILTNDNNIKMSNNFDVTMLWLDDEKLKINNAYYLKLGTKETLCYIKNINYKYDIDTNEFIDSKTVSKNEIINCNIECLEKIPLTLFDYNNYLGRLILINRVTNQTSSCATVNRIIEDNVENLFYYQSSITKNDRARLLNQKPLTIWFTGLSASGKSTIANELEKILVSNGYHTMLLDGDNIRLGINNDLGFSDSDRKENIRRVAHIAKLFNDAGLICITSFITPLNINRNQAKEIIGDNFFLIYIDVTIEECERRDKKGVYKKARAGKIENFTGIDSAFEKPINYNMIVHNDNAKECALEIFEKIKDKI